ncbi:uncharacterized protein PRCAT00003748001 [Priceomyces carsonii]|uniref:uncharacterized protein n=1 Tax=Priceomyces carsonii TaxID=28549 RepID=UPI002ED7E138|nr:unnamed protein product [Priceomyces carsonii]
MKTTDEKLQFKNHLFKLGQGRIINEHQRSFWEVFWQEPDNSNDIFELITVFDIRSIRDQNRVNFVLFLRALITKLVELSDTPEWNATAIKECLNCIRFLTRLVPCLYEQQTISEELEDEILWNEEFDYLKYSHGSPEEKKNITSTDLLDVLGVKLAEALVKLLFRKGFTSIMSLKSKSTSTASIWEPGVGMTGGYEQPNPILDSNRTEVLKLIITLSSRSFYQLLSELVGEGSKFLTILVTSTSKVELLSLVCSLINMICRSAKPSSSESGLVYDNNIELTEMRHTCVTYAVQLLSLMVSYPLPSSTTKFLTHIKMNVSTKPCNMARYYVGKLHKGTELLFLATNLIKILKSPLRISDSSNFFSNKGSTIPSLWSLEATMLIWEVFQCNKKFRKLIEEEYLDELTIILLFYIFTYHDVKPQRNLVQICCYFMLYISSKAECLDVLFNPVNRDLFQSLPMKMKTDIFPITTRDFLVTKVCQLLVDMAPISQAPPSDKVTSNLLMRSLVEILYNIVTPVSSKVIQREDELSKKLMDRNPRGGLSYPACTALATLIRTFGTRSFLLERPTHSDFLALIIRSICIAAMKYPKSSRVLLYSILENEKTYDLVWNTIYSFDSEYFIGNNLKSRNSTIDEEKEWDEDENVLEKRHEGDSKHSFSASPSLTRVESYKSDHNSVDLNSSDNLELSELSFIQSLSVPNSSRNSVVSFPNIPSSDDEVKENDIEVDPIDTALGMKPPIGMTEKAKEKLPKEAPLKRSWGGNDSLRILLTILIPHLKLILEEKWSRRGGQVEPFVIVKCIEAQDLEGFILNNKQQIGSSQFMPNVPLEPLEFCWSKLSLGWYISLLYGNIYNSIDSIKWYIGSNNRVLKNIATSFVSISKLTGSWTGFSGQSPSGNKVEMDWVNNSLTSINHWRQTSIRLFKIENMQNEGIFGSFKLGNLPVPGATGGVNDMANTIVRRLGDFRMNGSRASIISNGSAMSTPIEEQGPFFSKMHRGSTSSLHTLNKSRNNTPRNSFSL